mmetsp:Transcript_31351/g.40264  ORF Transcript_31351/g.40264 Transcript_31351/m.40264 type:complete len:226 (-) Transcript_31351:187-864(-)
MNPRKYALAYLATTLRSCVAHDNLFRHSSHATELSDPTSHPSGEEASSRIAEAFASAGKDPRAWRNDEDVDEALRDVPDGTNVVMPDGTEVIIIHAKKTASDVFEEGHGEGRKLDFAFCYVKGRARCDNGKDNGDEVLKRWEVKLELDSDTGGYTKEGFEEKPEIDGYVFEKGDSMVVTVTCEKTWVRKTKCLYYSDEFNGKTFSFGCKWIARNEHKEEATYYCD